MKTTIDQALSRKLITRDDADLIIAFVSEKSAEHTISPKRAYKLYYTLIGWRRFIGPFRTNTAADIYKGINDIETVKQKNGKSFKKNTIADYKRFIKRFYIWLVESGHSSIDIQKIRKISSPAYDTMTKTASMLLTEEEIKAMITACANNMDRALLMMLYEGGFRIGELGNLKWHQCSFNDWNVSVNVNDKTGKPRYLPLAMSRQYLAQWRNEYPQPYDPEAYVFLTIHMKQLQYTSVVKHLRDTAIRAGVKKHITPHIFRHSRITHMKQQGYDESVIKLMMWGNITTDMFRTYAHLTNQDIDREVAAKSGINTGKEKKESFLKAQQCPKCNTINGPSAKYCAKCFKPLSPDAIEKYQELEAEIDRIIMKRITDDLEKGVNPYS